MSQRFPTGKKRPITTHRTILAAGTEADVRGAYSHLIKSIEEVAENGKGVGLAWLPYPTIIKQEG